MADDTQLAQATQPFSFHDFLERMKEPAAADLVRKIKNFIKAFEERRSDPDLDSKQVQDFLADMEASFRHHPVWANASLDVQSQAVEALEKYLMTKLYHKTFAHSALDRERDELLAQRMAVLSFVTPEHLDIPEPYRNEDSWLLARRELLKMGQYKAPRDKLVCVLNCCRVINNLLHLGAANSNDAKGADDFLPILIYVVIHANPPQLASNLEFVQRYRMASRMVSEAAYFFTQLYSAASFIETINANSLTIDPDEFLARMVDAGVADVGGGAAQAGEGDPAGQQPYTQGSPPQKPTRQTSLPIAIGAAPGTMEQLQAAEDAAIEAAVAASLGAASVANGSSRPTSAPTPTQPLPVARPPPPPPPPLFPTASELEAEGVGQLAALESAGQLRGRHKYLYSSAADLTLGDVQQVLEGYKKLALHYEALSAGVQARRAASELQLQEYRSLPATVVPAAAALPSSAAAVVPAAAPVAMAVSAPAAAAGVPSPESASGSESVGDRRGSATAVLKMLNPFTRVPVPRSFKGTLSLLDGSSAGGGGGSRASPATTTPAQAAGHLLPSATAADATRLPAAAAGPAAAAAPAAAPGAAPFAEVPATYVELEQQQRLGSTAAAAVPAAEETAALAPAEPQQQAASSLFEGLDVPGATHAAAVTEAGEPVLAAGEVLPAAAAAAASDGAPWAPMSDTQEQEQEMSTASSLNMFYGSAGMHSEEAAAGGPAEEPDSSDILSPPQQQQEQDELHGFGESASAAAGGLQEEEGQPAAVQLTQQVPAAGGLGEEFDDGLSTSFTEAGATLLDGSGDPTAADADSAAASPPQQPAEQGLSAAFDELAAASNGGAPATDVGGNAAAVEHAPSDPGAVFDMDADLAALQVGGDGAGTGDDDPAAQPAGDASTAPPADSLL